ncbi:MAG: hypothetical protein JSU04_00130 [Bdellovibrionales bacterium]|nr:hypothetical protein [Bdellovibrionales bacterium]
MAEEKKRGRPAFELTDEQREKVADYAKVGCTMQEIAMMIGVAQSTLLKNTEFRELYKTNFEYMKTSLRRAMIQKALGDRNTGMLIWLSKQYLEFSDTPRETDLREREVVLKEKEFEKGQKPPTKHEFDQLISALTAQRNDLFDEEDDKAAFEALEGVPNGEA